MKKKILMMVTMVAVAFAACKKEQAFLPPVTPPLVKLPPELKKDTTLHSMVIIAPKADTILNAWTLDVKDAIGVTGIGGRIRFAYNGAFRPSTGFRNVYYVIKDADTVMYRSETKTTLFDGVNSFNQPVVDPSFNQAKTCRIEMHGEILSAATDGIGPDDQCTPTFEFIYQSDGNGTNKTLSAAGQTLTFARAPISVIETSLDLSNPRSQRVIGGTDVQLLNFTVTSIGGSNKILEQGFRFQNFISPTVTQVKVYILGGGLVGTGTISGQTAVVTLNSDIPENTILTYSLWVPVGTITSNFSGTNLKVTLDYVKYRSISGEIKTNQMDQVSNNLLAYKSTFSLQYVDLTGNIVDSVMMDAYRWIETASLGGPMAKKQNAFKVTFADVGNNDSLKLYPQMWENGADISNLGYFSNQNGDTITYLKEGDTKLYFTLYSGSGERVTLAGDSKVNTLKIRPVGFKHTGDGYKIQLLVDTIPLAFNFKLLNPGTNGFDAKVYMDQFSNSQAQRQNFIISDMSAGPSHSGIYFTTSNDWSGGYLIFGVPEGEEGLTEKSWTQP